MALLSSLTNRIFLASASLVAVSIGLAAYRVNASVTAQAERELQSGLTDAAALVDRLSRRQFQDFVNFASLVADLPRLSAGAADNDPPTAMPVAIEFQQKLGSDVFVVLGRTDRVLASAGPIRPADADVLETVAACRQRRDGTAFRVYGGSLIHVIALPLTAGTSSAGTLLAGFPLGREFADGIKAVTKSDIVIISGSRILASTLDDERTADLNGVSAGSRPFVRRLGNEEYVGLVQLLGAEGVPDEPIAIVLRSRTERLRFLPALRVELLGTGLIAILVATLIAYGVARTVTGPVRALTATMRDMAATGDLGRDVPEAKRWGDEDARMLASTFRQLTAALDRFRREAAQRERLSTLGRWSTVVAHEIRNPLMIIKSATRSLRKRAGPDVADVAASIDEEVQRLNGVVTDVLDFARPIRFDLAEGDLSEICRDAARAAQPGSDDVPVVVEGVRTAPLVTDRERLRSVLVNVVSNAQQAVRSTPAAPGSRPPVRVVIARQGADHWGISVMDRGVGVAPEDLPRLFEPFFTTRKTGSGLGLALARNIIEGLGGTINAESRLGAGTTIRIDLPERAERTEGRT